MSSSPSDPSRVPLSAEELASLVSTLQSEIVGLRAETTVKVQSLEDTIANLAHENALLKRRILAHSNVCAAPNPRCATWSHLPGRDATALSA